MELQTMHAMIPVVFLIFWLLQNYFPSRTFIEVPRWTQIKIGFLAMWATIGTMIPLLLPADWLHEHRLLDGQQLGILGGVLVGWPAWTFVQYWFHRSTHRFNWMWRMMHQLHHSAKRIETFVGAYFHPLELASIVLLNNVMNIFVFGLDPRAAAILGFMGAASVLFIHTNIRTPEWIGYLVYRPEAHLLHHQRGVHTGNFCDLPIWDLVFGTFRKPEGVYQGELGFENDASIRSMLAGVDVNPRTPLDSVRDPLHNSLTDVASSD